MNVWQKFIYATAYAAVMAYLDATRRPARALVEKRSGDAESEAAGYWDAFDAADAGGVLGSEAGRSDYIPHTAPPLGTLSGSEPAGEAGGRDISGGGARIAGGQPGGVPGRTEGLSDGV